MARETQNQQNPLENQESASIRVTYLNVQCLRTKLNVLNVFVSSNNPDVLCLSEHWLTYEESEFYQEIGDLKLVNINCRTSHKNGGAAVYVKDVHKTQNLDLSSFCKELNLEIAGTVLVDCNMVVLSIYRSDAGDFDTFLDLLDGCLSFVFGRFPNFTITLGGDFNILLNFETVQNKRITDILRSYGLYWSSTKPTRGPNCLDSSASNCDSSSINTEVIDAVVADHFAVVSDLNICKANKQTNQFAPWLKNYTMNIRKVDPSALPMFINALKNTNWNIDPTHDANLSFNMFFNTFLDMFDFYFPVKSIRPRSVQNKNTRLRQESSNEWYTQELSTLRSWVLLLHDMYKSSSTAAEKDRLYKLYLETKGQYRRSVDRAKRESNGRLIEESINPCKAAWNMVNNQQKKDPVSKCSASPDEVNNYFIQSVEAIVGDMPDRSIEAATNVVRPTQEWTTWREVSIADVKKSVSRFKSSPSLDVYGMSASLLKEIIDPIAEALTRIFNMCLRQGVFPDRLKLARTVPVFKKGDSSEISSYRPISIVPVIGKVLESIMNGQLMTYFEDNNLLTCMQHGFRRNKSTVTAVQALIKKVYDAFEDHESVILTLCDLTKAFDCTSHRILLLKLENYGMSGPVLATLQSYLSERSQVVTVRGASSQVRSIAHGVPQGSILGPLLFLILVNDLNTRETNALLYADDTTLITTGSNLDDLVEEASNSLQRAKNWFELNNLKLNEGKTQKLFCSLWSRPTNNLLDDLPENRVKLLGVFIDSKLSWNSHTEQVCVKLSRVTYLIRKLKMLVTPDFLLKVYYGLFHCHINYAIILWGHASCCDRVFIMQKTAIRLITSSERLAHCRPLFQQLKVLTVYSQYILNCILHLKTHTSLSELTRDKIHDHNTRGRKNLDLPQCRLSKVKDSYPVLAYRMFNRLPMHVRNLNLNQLKARLSSWLEKKSFYSLQEFFEEPVDDI